MWTKVVAPTVLVSLLWVTVSGGTTLYINWLFESHSRVLRENVATIQAAAGMEDVVWRLQAMAMQATEAQDAGLTTAMAALETAFEDHLSSAERIAITPEETALVAEIRDHFARYLREIRGGLAENGPEPVCSWERLENTVRLAHAVTRPCRRLLEVNERLLKESTVRRERLGSTVQMARFAFVIGGPAIGILFGILVARGLHRSISQISVTLRGATGELERELGRIDIGRAGGLSGLEKQVQTVSTQIRKVVEELHDARQEVIRAERLAAVGELAAGVAHEIRNPLTSVKLIIQTAAGRPHDRAWTGRQYQVVQEEISRMEKTVQGLLDFARPAQLHRMRHDLRDTLRRALNLMEGRARQEQVTISTDLPTRPVLVEGDPEQLHQVFVNLLLNGIEAMKQGGSLSVAMQVPEDAGGLLRVVFRDSGAGIPEAVMQRIFEPFITSKERGTGLGLAVSRRIVEEHGGKLTAANPPGGGAVFVVELPSNVQRRAAGPVATPRAGEVPGLAAASLEGPVKQQVGQI